ncbi:MAG: hypothetical protein K0V04_33330 [Deltaproteobacteria bacterium]|nr:hypothetical protein [Deltaproteobacteria bacterium]
MSDELLQALGERQRTEIAASDRGEGPSDLVRPLSGTERGAVLDAAFAMLDEPEATPSSPNPVVELQTSRRTPLLIAATVLAVAAAVLLWWNLGGREPVGSQQLAALPAYAITRLQAGNALDRAADAPVPREIELAADQRIETVITPARPVRTPVTLVVAARSDAGEMKLARPERGFEVSSVGAIRIDAPLDQLLPLALGSWSLALLVGSPGALPRDVEAWRDAPDPPPWRTVSVRAKIVASDRSR